MKLYLSDYFEVSEEALDQYGAFNISLVSDLPLFIDPFLLFNSDKPEYRRLQDSIIDYLRFLRDKSVRHKALSFCRDVGFIATRWDPFDNARHRFGVASESQTGCPSLADEKRKARR